MNTITVDQIGQCLGGKRSGRGWQCHCPAHDDGNPSLSISVGDDGKILYRCHAGCTQDSVKSALQARGLWAAGGGRSPEVKSEYVYKDLDGKPALKVVRRDLADGSKKIFQNRFENGRWVSGSAKVEILPFQFDRWAAAKDRWLFVVEGEKKVLALEAKGLLATCVPGGANAWRPTFARHFEGRKVCILPDNDPPGFSFAAEVYRDIKTQAADVRMVELPGLQEYQDVFDWLKAGHSVDELRALVENPPAHSPTLASALQSEHAEISIPNIEISKNSTIDCAPLPLSREIEPPQKFPMDALGTILGAAARRIHEIVKAPDGICGQSILGGAALAAQAHRDVVVDGRVSPISLNLIAVANSGERKSAADQEALKPHREYERELREQFDSQWLDFEIDSLAFKSAREAALKKAKTRDEKKVALLALGPPPQEPLSPLLLVEEPTYEGFTKLLAKGQPSLGLFSDEGGRLFGGHGMSEEHQLKTCTGFSELWDGKRTTRVRSGDGATLLFGKRVSMHLMVQGIVAQSVLANETLNQQGFLARCLISWPSPMAGQRPYETVDLSDDADLRRYRERISTVLRKPMPLAVGKRNELSCPALNLASDAKTLWVKFHDQVENQLADGHALAPIAAFASKSPQHALRIAAVLQVIEDPDAREIGMDELCAAIELTQYFLSETLRLKDSASIDRHLLPAKKLLEWAKQFEFIHLQKIYQFGPSLIRDAKAAKQAIKVLEDHRWIERLSGPMELDGAVRREVWKVRL